MTENLTVISIISAALIAQAILAHWHIHKQGKKIEALRQCFKAVAQKEKTTEKEKTEHIREIWNNDAERKATRPAFGGFFD